MNITFKNKLDQNIVNIINKYVDTGNVFNDDTVSLSKSSLCEMAMQIWLLGREEGTAFLGRNLKSNLESSITFIDQMCNHMKVTDENGNYKP